MTKVILKSLFIKSFTYIYKIKIKEVEEETLESDEEVDDQPKIPTEKIGTKKARKLEEKEARAMQRKIEEEERQKAKELREEKHAERMKRLEEEGIKFYVFPKQINKKFFVKMHKLTLASFYSKVRIVNTKKSSKNSKYEKNKIIFSATDFLKKAAT